MRKSRVVKLSRETDETIVKVKLNLDGRGMARISTGVNFFDHLLGAFSTHGLFDLEISVKLKKFADEHHAVEDVAIVLGRALDSALGDRKGIARFGYAIIPMDDALILASVDNGGRRYCSTQVDFRRKILGDMPVELIPHFLETMASNGRFTIHVVALAGKNDHHKAEAIFKAFGMALSQSVRREKRVAGKVPSQKGVL